MDRAAIWLLARRALTRANRALTTVDRCRSESWSDGAPCSACDFLCQRAHCRYLRMLHHSLWHAMEQWPSGGSGEPGEAGQAQHVRTCWFRPAPRARTARCMIAGSGERRKEIPHHQLPRRTNFISSMASAQHRRVRADEGKPPARSHNQGRCGHVEFQPTIST